jgi:hypothetical protein
MFQSPRRDSASNGKRSDQRVGLIGSRQEDKPEDKRRFGMLNA